MDDNKQIRNLIKKILKKTFPDVIAVEATDGKDAVEQFTKEKPDLITMDILMDNMDGVEAIKKIISISDKTKIIVISQLPEDEYKQETLNAGAIEYLNKESLTLLPEMITRICK